MINAILEMIGIGRVTLVDDTDVVQRMQVDQGPARAIGMRKLIEGALKVGHFGFTSVPPIGSEVVMVRPAASKASSIVIGTNHQQSRPRDLAEGDSAIYDVRGQRLSLTADGAEIDCQGLACRIVNAASVTIVSAGAVHVEAPEMQLTGNLTLDGTVTAAGFITS